MAYPMAHSLAHPMAHSLAHLDSIHLGLMTAHLLTRPILVRPNLALLAHVTPLALTTSMDKKYGLMSIWFDFVFM